MKYFYIESEKLSQSENYFSYKIMSSKEFPKISGTYLLLMNLSYPKKIKVGALGELIFKPGRYIYVGSALKGRLYHRLLRHVKPAAQKKFIGILIIFFNVLLQC